MSGPGPRPGAGADAAPAPAALPTGGRDALPPETAELRLIEGAIGATFARFGYREVMTPVLELADVLDRAQEGGLGAAYRLFDEAGRVLVLRPDLTIPVARLVATRMTEHPGPVRVRYIARAFRPPRAGRSEAAEQRQAGIELVGADGPDADAEAIAAAVLALRAAGVTDLRVGIGSVALVAAALEALGVRPGVADGLWGALRGRDLVRWRELARDALVDPERASLLAGLPGLRGDEVARLADLGAGVRGEVARLSTILALLDEHGVGEAVRLDLAVMRGWPYYSGLVVEAYAPGVGQPLAMGGRYDGLAGRFGVARPAVGIGIALDAVHRALADATGPLDEPRRGVVVAEGASSEIPAAVELRAAGVPAVAAREGRAAEALARADGWRFWARREGEEWIVSDLARGDESAVRDLVAYVEART